MVRVIAMVVLVCGPLIGSARAQPAAPDPTEAQRWLDAGDVLIKGGDKLSRRGHAEEAMSQYERALLSYQKAQELSGNPKVYFAIAAAEEKLGRPGDALIHYRRVTLLVEDKTAPVVVAATKRFAELAETVGVLMPVVVPDGADLALDGNPIGKSPLPDPIVLQPGSYKLTITADAYQPMEVKIDIEAGSESERTFTLEPIPVLFQRPVDAPAPDQDRGPPPPSRFLLWAGAGATLALTATATTTGALAIKRHKVFVDPESSASERKQAHDSGQRLSVATDVFIVGAVLAAGFTTYYYLAVYKPKVRAHHRMMETRAKAAVVPWVQPSIDGSIIGLAVTY